MDGKKHEKGKIYKVHIISANGSIETTYGECIEKIKGVSDTQFNPEGTITREEAAVMVQRAAKLCGMAKHYGENAVRDILAGFVDYVKSSDWARESLAFCYDNGILPDSDIEILPKTAVTRE